MELELVALEENVIETPSVGREDSRDTHLTPLDLKSEVNSPHASVSSRPRLPRSSVRGMTESTKGLTIDEDLRDDIDGLVTSETQQFRNDGGRGEFDEDDVVETYSVERVLEGHASLNLVGFDHRFEDVLHLEGLSGTREVIGNGEDSSEVVGRVTPFSSEEAWNRKVRKWRESCGRGKENSQLSGKGKVVSNSSTRKSKYHSLVEIEPSDLSSDSESTTTKRATRSIPLPVNTIPLVLTRDPFGKEYQGPWYR